MKTLDRLVANDSELLINGYQDGTVLVAGHPSRVGIVNCLNVRIELEDDTRAIQVSGVGGGNQEPLVIAHSSRDVSLGAFSLIGLVDETNKGSWEKTVPNGIEIHHSCQSFEIDHVYGKNLHYAVQGRCEEFILKGGELEYISGDFLRATRDNFHIDRVIGRYSLDVLGYTRIHRDHAQFWQEDKSRAKMVTIAAYKDPDSGVWIPEHTKQLPVLTGGVMENCKFWTPDTGHKWASSSDGVLFSEELYEKVTFRNNHIYTNNVNALRGGVMRDCTFENNLARRADEVTL